MLDRNNIVWRASLNLPHAVGRHREQTRRSDAETGVGPSHRWKSMLRCSECIATLLEKGGAFPFDQTK